MPDHPRELFLGERHAELVFTAGQLDEPLRGPPGDVEEHGVGQRLVGRTEPPGQDRDDGPQQVGLAGEHLADVVELEARPLAPT